MLNKLNIQTIISVVIQERRVSAWTRNQFRKKSRIANSDNSSMSKVRVPVNMTERVQLNDGTSMPVFGLGLNKSTTEGITAALRLGYPMLDSAEYHQNEEQIRQAMIDSHVRREDVYIVSKLWENDVDCRHHVETSLKKLGIDYFDLYLIHTPAKGNNVETYKVMLELQKEGKIRSVGVSNFAPHHLQAFEDVGLPRPTVNQIELHPWHQQNELVKFCRRKHIVVMGYCPLAKGRYLKEPWLVEMAARYNKTTAQVLIRWSVQNGYVTIPKSDNPERLRQNTLVFDWSLQNEDMAILNSQPEARICWSFTDDPCESKWLG